VSGGQVRDILGENDRKKGRLNDHQAISERKAKKIAGRLIELTEKGQVETDVKEYEEWRKALPDEECDKCSGTGELDGECPACKPNIVALRKFFSESVSSGSHPCEGSGTSGGCHLCDGSGTLVQAECYKCKGTGKVRPWSTNYPMSAEVIRDFTEFCMNSGGFVIS
jgi:DnaJ-class molecular chaperone